MKTIPLKVVEVVIDGKPQKLSYKHQLREIMRTPSDPRGADYEEVRRSIRVLDALDAATGDSLVLEDADYLYLKGRVAQARWPIISAFVVAFTEDIVNLP